MSKLSIERLLFNNWGHCVCHAAVLIEVMVSSSSLINTHLLSLPPFALTICGHLLIACNENNVNAIARRLFLFSTCGNFLCRLQSKLQCDIINAYNHYYNGHGDDDDVILVDNDGDDDDDCNMEYVGEQRSVNVAEHAWLPLY